MPPPSRRPTLYCYFSRLCIHGFIHGYAYSNPPILRRCCCFAVAALRAARWWTYPILYCPILSCLHLLVAAGQPDRSLAREGEQLFAGWCSPGVGVPCTPRSPVQSTLRATLRVLAAAQSCWHLRPPPQLCGVWSRSGRCLLPTTNQSLCCCCCLALM